MSDYDPIKSKCFEFIQLLADHPSAADAWGVLLCDAARELGDKMPGPHDPMLRYWRAAFMRGYELVKTDP